MTETFFRHAYGQLVSTLCRRVGVQHLEEVEDAVQAALLTGVETWPRDGCPDDAMAWLYRVAHRALLDALRKGSRRRRILAQRAEQLPSETGVVVLEPPLPSEVDDDLLRMLFVCCDPVLPVASQLALALKTLCGFSVGEIAQRLFVAEAAAYKRLGRARERLRTTVEPAELGEAMGPERRGSVLRVLYQLFTEGHLSVRADHGLRRELCEEAIRLGGLLAEHPIGAHPETHALLALMYLHSARMDARIDDLGGLLLLEEQDRSRWDRTAIEIGLAYLARSAEGEVLSRYHVEAGIAAEHCLAPNLEATRWDRVVLGYEQLNRLAPSPLHRLHRAMAVAAAEGPEAGLASLEGDLPPAWLEGSYLWAAALADLHRRCGHAEAAAAHRDTALELAPTDSVRVLLARRLGA